MTSSLLVNKEFQAIKNRSNGEISIIFCVFKNLSNYEYIYIFTATILQYDYQHKLYNENTVSILEVSFDSAHGIKFFYK